MKILLYPLLLAISLTLILSCKYHVTDNNSINDSIVVYYYMGWVDLPICKELNTIRKEATYKKRDTVIYIKRKDYERIISYIKRNVSTTKKMCRDCRFVVMADSTLLGFGYPDLFTNDKRKDSLSISLGNTRKDNINDKELHLINCISGYYNYFKKQELYSNKMVMKYGLPKNYKYAYREIDDIYSAKVVNGTINNGIQYAKKIDFGSIAQVHSTRKVVIKAK